MNLEIITLVATSWVGWWVVAVLLDEVTGWCCWVVLLDGVLLGGADSLWERVATAKNCEDFP